jgi:hypothetical protein
MIAIALENDIVLWGRVSERAGARRSASVTGRGRPSIYLAHSQFRVGVYRGEVLAMMFALADIQTDTNEILAILGGEEDGDEEEEVDA